MEGAIADRQIRSQEISNRNSNGENRRSYRLFLILLLILLILLINRNEKIEIYGRYVYIPYIRVKSFRAGSNGKRQWRFYERKRSEAALFAAVKKRHGLPFKFVSPGMSGVPDRVVLLPDGKIGFVELKAPGKKMRPLQEKRKRQLEAPGFLVFCMDEIEASCYLSGKCIAKKRELAICYLERQYQIRESQIEAYLLG